MRRIYAMRWFVHFDAKSIGGRKTQQTCVEPALQSGVDIQELAGEATVT